MSVDLEAGGALATAGLAASAIEGQSSSNKEPTPICANCKAQLVGRFCHACGQTAHVHRSIWHMLEEGLHGVLHFDSKLWRTLPLLVARPGLLTRRYIDGQRVRYVSPLALFLFTIFLMFFVLSFVNDDSSSTQIATSEQEQGARAELAKNVDQAKAEIAKKTNALAAAKDAGERTNAASELEEAQLELRQAEAVLSLFDKAAAADGNPQKTTVVTGEELKALTGVKLEGFGATASDVIKQAADNPDLMLYKFRNTAYKFSFMLIPISLPFLWMMFFWKRDVTIYDHMVFSMFSLSFMSLLFVVIVLMGMSALGSRFNDYVALVPPLHMFLQLKETYRLGYISALWRTFALLIAAGTAFIAFMAMVAAITAM
jgi:Protein of unknown function (DUF3667)